MHGSTWRLCDGGNRSPRELVLYILQTYLILIRLMRNSIQARFSIVSADALQFNDTVTHLNTLNRAATR